jgi:HemY protein
VRTLVAYILVLIFAVFVGLLVVGDPGYVLFSFHHWTMEMPFWLCVLIAIIVIWVIYFLWRLLYDVFSHHGKLRSWHRFRGVHTSHSSTSEGLIALIQGYWSRAEKLLIDGVKRSRTPLINYLSAAKAAQEQHKINKRDEYIELARNYAPKQQLAVGLMEAELKLQEHEYESALATLKQVHKIAPKHQTVLELLQKTYSELGDWEHVLQLMPALQRHDAFTENELADIEAKAYAQQFAQAKLTVTKLKACWDKLPRRAQSNLSIIKSYAKQLIKKHADADASAVLLNALKKTWDDELMALYAQAHSDSPEVHFKQAKGFLKNHPNNANLLMSLGKIAIHSKAWEDAKDYLQQAIDLEPTAEAYIQLGLTYQQLGDNTKAFSAYQQGAALLS